MKALTATSLLALVMMVPAQDPKEQWQRVYTGEDSVVELETSSVTFVEYHLAKKVTFASTRAGRVRFRTIFSRLQTLDEKPVIKYKSHYETLEFQCPPRTDSVVYPRPVVWYRRYEATLRDARGKTVKSYDADAADLWREIKSGSLMEKRSDAACRLIDQKRQNP